MSKVNTGVALPLWVVTLGALLVFLSMAALVIGVIQGPGTGDASETPPLYDEQLVVSLYEKANPAVVRVETVINTPDRFGFLFPHGGQGSGFLTIPEFLQQRQILEVEGVGFRIGRTSPSRLWGLEHHREVTESRVADQPPEWLRPEVAATDAVMPIDAATKRLL